MVKRTEHLALPFCPNEHFFALPKWREGAVGILSTECHRWGSGKQTFQANLALLTYDSKNSNCALIRNSNLSTAEDCSTDDLTSS